MDSLSKPGLIWGEGGREAFAFIVTGYRVQIQGMERGACKKGQRVFHGPPQ
jgi:hypothetical protein